MAIKDTVRFQHMLEAANAILIYAKGRRRHDLDSDRQFLSAILREFEIIGEAANKISEPTKKRFSHIPWKEMIGMRNRLIHAYFDVDHDVIWTSIRHYLPEFRKALVGIIETLKEK